MVYNGFVTKVKILDVIWKENVDTSIVDPSVIGIVAFQSNPDNWEAYMGITRIGWAIKECTKQELRDAAKTILKVGAPLTKEQAHAFFPQLDIAHYDK
jgi:hypothetical protein